MTKSKEALLDEQKKSNIDIDYGFEDYQTKNKRLKRNTGKTITIIALVLLLALSFFVASRFQDHCTRVNGGNVTLCD